MKRIWRLRLILAKQRLQMRGLRWALVILQGAFAADGFAVDTYERLVADPLQLRGVSLKMQVKSLYTVAAILCLFLPTPHLINLIPSVIWLSNGIFRKFPWLDVKSEDNPFRNPFRETFMGLLCRSVILCLTVLMLPLHCWYWLAILMADLTEACDPKPPRPRRIKVLITAHNV